MIRFGIIGAGNIARKFRNAVSQIQEAEVIAVASKDSKRAKYWAQEEDVPAYFGNYEKMLQEPSIDAVYIATTNNFHYENIMLCLHAGKHVLCEKPLAMTYDEAQKVTKLAKEKQLFLMECMWTRFLPVTQTVRNWIQNGKIGNIKLMQATIGWVADKNYNHRLFSPELGGGSLHDLCVYPLELFPYYTNQNIIDYTKTIQKHSCGVNDLINLNLTLEHSLANIQCSFTTKLPEDAYLYGDKGYIRVPKFHFGNTAYLYDTEDNLIEACESPDENGFIYEIREAISCIRTKKTESSVCPHSMTLETCKIFDACLKELS